MDFTLTEAQKRLREEIIQFARTELQNERVIERDRDQKFPHELWLKCGEQKFQGLPVPVEFGGRGLDSLTTALALEALGYGCHDSGLVFAIGAQLLACVVAIWKHGSDHQRRRYLPDLCTGKLIAVNGMTEPGSGSDAFAMTTAASPDGDGFRINGVKTLASNGPVADLAVVYAMTDAKKGYHGGVTAFLVEKGTPGYRVSERFNKMGVRTVMMGQLFFENAFVPAEAVLGAVGAGAAIFTQSMEWERICLVAGHLGTMERLMEKAIRHARTRKAYGQAIGKFQAVAHKIADMKVRLEAARLLTYRSAWRLDKVKNISMDASITKLFTSEALVQTALDTLQTLGGSGFLVENEVERAVRDALASTIYSGTSEIQRNIIARWLGL